MKPAVAVAAMRRAPSAPRHLMFAALGAAAAVALVVLLTTRIGAITFVLCLPAAAAAVLTRLRLDARQRGLRLLSQQDALTGLGNRRLLHERLNYEIARHRRHGRRFSVFALDLDGFKQVNDRFGHHAGDEILREVASALRRVVRDQDTVVRMGGDEFCVLAPEMGWQQADQLSGRLNAAVAKSVAGLDGLGVSVGFAVYPDEGWTPEHLLQRADAAEAAAKRASRAGRGRPPARAA
jgi:diguanylate cyclase (GGDEF)-like protein